MSYPAFNDLSAFTASAAHAIEEFVSYLWGWLSKEHKDDGSHSSVTADDITITKNTVSGATGNLTLGGRIVGTGTGQNTFVGDVVALQGSGSESGIGTLSTVNGAALETGEASRTGLLLGGVTNGFWFEQRAAGSPFDSGYELRLWNLKWDSTTAALRFGITSSRPVLMDGGTGSTAIDLGSTSRYLHSVYAGQFFRSDYGSAQGEWTSFTPTQTATTGTWTGSTITTAAYMLLGKTIFINFEIDAGNNSAATANLIFAIPGGFTAAKSVEGRGIRALSLSAEITDVRWHVTAGGTTVSFDRDGGTNWPINAANGNYVRGSIFFEVQ